MTKKFDQLAIYTNGSAEEWQALAIAHGCTVHDRVVAKGFVGDWPGLITNVATLAFEYERWPMELEVLRYESGSNFLLTQNRSGLSHFGRHVETRTEMDEMRGRWRVAQEVVTVSHSNPAIADQRWYHYVIYKTRDMLGADTKFIRRLNREEQTALLAEFEARSQRDMAR